MLEVEIQFSVKRFKIGNFRTHGRAPLGMRNVQIGCHSWFD
jgi:hypothetical protein